MFNTPIKHTRLSTLEEVKDFSFTNFGVQAKPMTYCQNNGQIAYADNWGWLYVTPYRSEIREILEKEGYREGAIFVPFSNGEEMPEAYKWLSKIADEENWAETYEMAFQVATEKGIKPVKVENQKFHIMETRFYYDEKTGTSYKALAIQFLLNDSRKNIGTYIIIDEKTLAICDEYGRTFLVRAKTIINDLVNSLIDAGYTRTVHPEWYIQHYAIADFEDNVE